MAARGLPESEGIRLLLGYRIAVVLPAYNAANTLRRTFAEIPHDIVDEVILTDDHSRDDTPAIARELGIHTLEHESNRGYGGNQKTCYAAALARGADIVVMLHPDYQYTPKLVTAMASMIASDQYDVVLGSRILGRGALAGGMPIYKYIFNRLLTLIENVLVGQKLSEYHTGYRAWSRRVLEALPIMLCSEDFVFDNEMLAQSIYAGFRIGEISCPTKYFPEASSINFRRSVIYGIGVLRTAVGFRLHRWGVVRSPIFAPLDFSRAARGCQAARAGPMISRASSQRGVMLTAIVVAAVVLTCLAMGIVRPGVLTTEAQRFLDAARNAAAPGFAAFVVLQLIVAASGILPASVLGVAAGTAYGLPLGFLLAALGTMAGALVSFGLSRSLFRDAIARQLARRPGLARFDALLAQDGWRIVCLLRVSPVMPFAATSYVLGMSAVGIQAYVLGTLASLPALLGYVYIGTLADAGLSLWTTGAAPLQWAFLGFGGFATAVLTLIIGRLARHAIDQTQTEKAKPRADVHGTAFESVSSSFGSK